MSKNSLSGLVEAAEKELAADPGNALRAVDLIDALVAAEQVERVDKVLSGLSDEVRESAPVLVAVARAFLLAGDEARSAEFAGKAAEREPQEPGLLLALAEIVHQHGDMEKALGLARRARSVAPDHPEVGLAVLEIMESAGAGTDARAEAARILGNHKASPVVVAHLGALAHRHGDLDLAVNLLSLAALADPPVFEAYYPLGLIFWDHVRGEPFARDVHLQKLKQGGLDPFNLRELGWIEMISGNRPAGARLLLAGLDAFDPAPPPLLLEQWSGEEDGRSVEEVLDDCALHSAAAIPFGAARFYHQRGMLDLEEGWLRATLDFAPEQTSARLELVRLLSVLEGREEEAAAELDLLRAHDDAGAYVLEIADVVARLNGESPEDSAEARAGSTSLLPSGERGVLALHGRPVETASSAAPVWRGGHEIIDRALRILCRPRNRSVLVSGESGVGKTALITEVVRRIASGDCPQGLNRSRVVELSPTALQTDIKYLGEWQTKIMSLAEEVKAAPGTIIYIPRFHHLMGAGATMNHEEDMASALAPLLADGHLVVIGEGNPEPLKRMFRARPELERGLNMLELKEPPRVEVRHILLEARSWIRDGEGPRIESAAVDRAVDLCSRFLRHVRFPAKGIELLRSAYESVREEDGSLVAPEDVAREMSTKTGLPNFLLLDSEPLDLEKAAAYFRERILGQEEGLTAMLDTVARIKTGLQDPSRPLSNYLFTGPTGVGKTETAKALAGFLFGDERRLIRFDMSEYADPFAADRLIEAREKGSGSRGQMTGAVRETPLSVLLLDEIEKAHPRVFDLLLQVLGEGRLTDARGETVDFRECVIIMTSNLGAEHGGEGGLGFTSNPRAAEAAAIREEVQRFFRPEFLNRLDRIVSFGRLETRDLRTIALREIGRCVGREGVVRRGVAVEIDPRVADQVLARGESARYGARQLKRAVEELVSVPLARELASHRVGPDDTVRLIARKSEVLTEIVRDDGAGAAPVPLPARDAPVRSLPKIRAHVMELEHRSHALRGALGVPEAVGRAKALRRSMERPGFWDDVHRSAVELRSLADINRLLDRDKEIRERLEESALLVDLVREGQRDLLPEADRKLDELAHFIEWVEIETLLTDPGDARGAYLVITAGAATEDEHQWVQELVKLYRGWAGRRGYEAELVGERPPSGAEGHAAIVLVEGQSAYGLLRTDTGTHRKVQAGAEGDNRKVMAARVLVLPEPSEHVENPGAPHRAAKRAKLQFLRRATGQVSVCFQKETWPVFVDQSPEQGRQLAADLTRALAESGEAALGQASAIARTVVMSQRRTARDPRTGHETPDVRSVLDGGIDDFILAALVSGAPVPIVPEARSAASS